MTTPQATAYVMKDGEVLGESYMERYAVSKNNPHSHQITEDSFKDTYTANNLVEPIYNPAMLAQLMDLSTWHAAAVRTKAHDVAGLGWTVEAIDGVEEPNEADKARAIELLRNIHPELSLTELLDQFATDYEATGDAYLEVIRDTAGTITGLEHVPAHTIRIHVEGEKFQQKRGNKIVWFARYGSDPISRTTGSPDDVTTDNRAHELIHLKSYSPQSDYYGVPDVIPALGAILGDTKRQEYNISFFDNHAIPAYAVTVSGADLDDDTKADIRRFFQKDVKESPHSTLVLAAQHPSNAPDAPPIKFEFQQLSTEVKEASFSVFRGQNRDEILSAHRVPPYRAGIVAEGQMGGSSAAETTEIYKQSIVNPRKQRIEDRLTRVLLRDGLGIDQWRINLGELDTRDLEAETQRMVQWFNIGMYTPNDLLKHYGMDTSDQPGMDDHYINGQPVGQQTNDDQMAALLRSQKDMLGLLAAAQVTK